MKPRNKTQQHLADIVAKLPELTPSQVAYFERHSFDTVIGESRGRMLCSDCGHFWKQDGAADLIDARCPHCGHMGQVKHHSTKTRQIEYFVVSKAVEKWQMFRYFQITRIRTKNEVKMWNAEVGVVFLDEKGHRTPFARTRNPFATYFDCWSWGSPIELRHSCLEVFNRIGVLAMRTYSIMPVLKRNGWNGKPLNYDPINLPQKLLTTPEIESYWKIGQHGIVAECLYNSVGLNPEERRLASIATRHGRMFSTREEWRDFMDFIRDLKYLGKDIFNPSIILPANFQEAHEIWHQRAQQKRQKEEQERIRRRKLEEIERDKKKQEWLKHYVAAFDGLDIQKDGYRIVPLVTLNDFQAEGEHMHHCICTYYGKPNTLLLSISFNDQKQETAEIDLKGKRVVQCRGVCNKPSPHHDVIVDLLESSMRQFVKLNKIRIPKSKPKETPITTALVKTA